MCDVLTIVGVRPQFVKAAMVSRALAGVQLDEAILHTGQHYDAAMSEVFFRELSVPAPRYTLDVRSLRHGAQTGRMLEGIEDVLVSAKPRWVLVYGDTNSTLAGALAAAKLHIPVAHVEAGLRSFDRQMPEEINRVVVDHLSDLLLAPTASAVQNLRSEGIGEERIRLVGDVMHDAAAYFGRAAQREPGILAKLKLERGSYCLATVHRAENTDSAQRLRAIFEGFRSITRLLPVVIPLHPRTRGALARHGLLPDAARGLLIIEPVGYLDMLRLEQSARVIVTDSGGVQKEAAFHGVPCVTLRASSEWTEPSDNGSHALLLPSSAEDIFNYVEKALGNPPPKATSDPHGRGEAAIRIAACLYKAIREHRQ